MGLITTKVRSDGRFFLASIDKGMDGQGFRDAHPPLEKNHVYWGHFLADSVVGESPWIEYSARESAEFRGDELEELPGEFRLINTSKESTA